MKNTALAILVSFSIPACSQLPELTENDINAQLLLTEQTRNEFYEGFVDPERSPLDADSIPYHRGLHYFEPMDPKYIVMAKFERIENGRTFEMQTTTDRLPVYRDFALLTFEIDGQEYTLHAYQNIELSKQYEYKEYLFVPFNDHTNGIESYGGGRYLDIYQPIADAIILNFHLAYNPYCAYNDRYSCPIPPQENKLEVRIEAGIKKYH